MADEATHDRIERERKAALPNAERVRDFRSYARGEQRGTLTVQQQRVLRGVTGHLFCDNVCKRILGELRNRLRLARFEVDGTGAAAEAVLAYLESLWTLNQLPKLSAAVHWAMMRDGNHAVGLAWKGAGTDGRVNLTRERWWNGKSGIFVSYDDGGQATYAVKEWTNGEGRLRRTVWWPERIERYIQNGAGWEPHKLESDGGVWPQPWVDRIGQPLGIPIVHFSNVQVPNDGPGDEGPSEPDPLYGMSELDGGILGLQDEINDLHRDITAAARFAGFQLLYATGVQQALDEQGNAIPYTVEPGAMLTDGNPDSRFGTLAPGSLAELQTALEVKLKAVSRMAGIPMRLITGDWPSGEALLRDEMPLIDKVETLGAAAGPAWASVGHKSTKMQNAFGGGALDEQLLISSVFVAAARRDPLTMIAIANGMAPHVSEREVLMSAFGYSTKDAERIMAEKQAERQAAADLAARRLAPQPQGEASDK
jgi:hypothetical protein